MIDSTIRHNVRRRYHVVMHSTSTTGVKKNPHYSSAFNEIIMFHAKQCNPLQHNSIRSHAETEASLRKYSGIRDLLGSAFRRRRRSHQSRQSRQSCQSCWVSNNNFGVNLVLIPSVPSLAPARPVTRSPDPLQPPLSNPSNPHPSTNHHVEAILNPRELDCISMQP